MKPEVLSWLACPICQAVLGLNEEQLQDGEVRAGLLTCAADHQYRLQDFVPRFVSTDEYVDSFSFEWNRHRTTQLDSANGTTESEERFQQKPGLPARRSGGQTGSGRWLWHGAVRGDRAEIRGHRGGGGSQLRRGRLVPEYGVPSRVR